MPKNNLNSAVAYYQAMQNKDLPGIERYLHPDISFLSPFSEVNGKEKFLEAIKGFMNMFNTIHVRAKCGSENQAMIAYDVEFPEPIGLVRTAALMTFKEGLVARVELFFDVSVFGKK